MKTRFLSTTCCLALFATSGFAADSDKPEKKQATEAEIRARLEDHLLKKRTEAAKAAQAEKKAPESNAAAPVANSEEAKAQPAPAAGEAAKTPAPADTTVLPKVEVRKEKITELDRQLAKQNREIAREKENTKPTALDETINGPKVSRFFAIFGGQSSDDRANIAKERVAMMEEERDLIEAIAQAPTKEEKAELQKTLDDMRAMRRELEQSLR
jgi:hypothetical protein